jgi:hypothetical protein
MTTAFAIVNPDSYCVACPSCGAGRIARAHSGVRGGPSIDEEFPLL